MKIGVRSVILISLLCACHSCIYKSDSVLGKDSRVEILPELKETMDSFRVKIAHHEYMGAE